MAHGKRAGIAGGRVRGGLFTCFRGGGDTIESTFSSSGEDAENGRGKQRKHRKAFSKMVRSVAYLSCLYQSGRGQEIRKKLFEIHLPDTSSEKSSAPSTSRSMNDDDRTMEHIFSSSCPSSSSSSSLSLSSDPETRPRSRRKPKPARIRKTRMPMMRPQNHVSATAMFLSVLGLFMMLFCGKLVAILWTCTCFYFVPRRSSAGATAVEAPAAIVLCAAADEV